MAKLTKWTEPAEILTTIGVIVTLIFLIVEVRENTAVVKTESYGQSIDRLNEWRLTLASDPELTRLFTEFYAGGIDDFDPIERQQFTFIYGALWSIYETAYYARSYETMGTQEWNRYHNMLCQQLTLSVSSGFWTEKTKRQFTPEFLSAISESCEQPQLHWQTG